ncbi:MAG: nucleotidyltransferase family protein [Thermoleophilia bacterium]
MSTLEMFRNRRDEICAMSAEHGARDIRLFGSVARGEDGPDPDVDFLVRFDVGTALLDQAGLISELEGLLGRKVDVVSERGLKERIRDRVFREATPL